jgi:AraC-like DNA-binding protein
MPRSKGFLLESSWKILTNALGIPLSNVLRRARLPEDLLVRGSVRLDAAEQIAFWDALGAEANDPWLPFRLVEARATHSLSPAHVAAVCCRNLASAAQRVARYQQLVALATLDVESTTDSLSLGLRWPSPSQLPALMVLTEFAFWLGVARSRTGRRIVPRRIVTCHPLRGVEAVEASFGTRVEAGPHPILAFQAEDAMLPFKRLNGNGAGPFVPSRSAALTDLDGTALFRDRVRAVLHEGLPRGEFTMNDVARRLAVSRRTLQRRLNAEGTTFLQVLTHLREGLARYYLTRTDLSCTQIAFLLGFEDPNSFFRAFHDWTGATPERSRSKSVNAAAAAPPA